MDIDPRMLTTPIGAAVGVAVARKVLKGKDLTLGNQAIGAGLGGGAGFVAGQMIRGQTTKPTRKSGLLSPEDLQAMHEQKPLLNVNKDDPHWFMTWFPILQQLAVYKRFKQHQTESLGPKQMQTTGLARRMQARDQELKQPGLAGKEKKSLIDLQTQDDALRRQLSDELLTDSALSGSVNVFKAMGSHLQDKLYTILRGVQRIRGS
jgi:hypothetical protein